MYSLFGGDKDEMHILYDDGDEDELLLRDKDKYSQTYIDSTFLLSLNVKSTEYLKLINLSRQTTSIHHPTFD